MSGICVLLAGGFRLTKFSNSKEVLLPIPEADRRQGINKKELLEFVLGNERALGVLCDTQMPSMGFNQYQREAVNQKRNASIGISSLPQAFS